MRLATWNVAWFKALFDDAGRVMAGDAPSAEAPDPPGGAAGGSGAAFSPRILAGEA